MIHLPNHRHADGVEHSHESGHVTHSHFENGKRVHEAAPGGQYDVPVVVVHLKTAIRNKTLPVPCKSVEWHGNYLAYTPCKGYGRNDGQWTLTVHCDLLAGVERVSFSVAEPF